MGSIRILPDSISNRIAAGEVIERPASVVKELVENSIDAGADKITVQIENSGTKLISVTDNGRGMDSDDAILCLEPHATSKISHAEDINRIYTLGFRGEALPSIASVSRLRLRTRRKNDIEGTEVYIEGGRFTDSVPVGCAPGTEINVRDLFFNTPARKKFLHSKGTEERHIQETLWSLSLGFPSVSFELLIDGRIIFSSPSDRNLLSRIQTFFGKEMPGNLIPVENSGADLKISGYMARHGFTKNSRREQRIFVNHRPVESAALYAGIREGYGSLTNDGRFPPVFLFLEMDPGLVDVNVHPAKREVRFREGRLVTSFISDSIRDALRNSQAPTVSVGSDLQFRSILAGAGISYAPKKQFQDTGMFDENMGRQVLKNIQIPSGREKDIVPSESGGRAQPAEACAEPEEHSAVSELKILAFLDETYILASSKNGLVIIDQHAAHERVMFEKILNTVGKTGTISQKLLIPITVELSRSEVLFLGKYSSHFSKLGFEFESFGANTVIVNSIPSGLPQENLKGLFSDMLSILMEEGRISGKIDEASVARAACKHSVKAHDRISFEEAKSLLRQLSRCELPFSCPHGRPVIINISYRELEKRFGRRK
ncbi:MAG: DNA mismatch repair endonuclease MutL [Victivallales bacterium]